MLKIFPELERKLLLFHNLFVDKLNKEKNNVEQMLQKYQWISVEDKEQCTCAAVDSSFHSILTRMGYVYVIQGIAMMYDVEKNNTMKPIDFNIFADVGLITIETEKEKYGIKRKLFKRVLAQYAYMLELEKLVELIDKHVVDLILLDGSLISFITSVAREKIKIYVESTKDNHKLESIDLKSIENKKNEYIHKLSKTKYSIFLSKSSDAGFYTHGFYTDMHILELARWFKIYPYYKSGFLEPLTFSVRDILSKFTCSIHSSIDRFSVTYIRLEDGAPIYQISFPYHVQKNDVMYVAKRLRSWSPMGYPIPLKKVHETSKIPKKQIIDAMTFLGIPIATGRELVEI